MDDIEIVEFELGGEHYALDIQLVREIVEMKPITEIPRTPPYIKGIMNLRGEITTILSLNHLLSIADQSDGERKIIVL
ncbi:MAG: Chemotaxis signal transduction protein, partial [Methanomicrobiales archaeon 53_19]